MTKRFRRRVLAAAIIAASGYKWGSGAALTPDNGAKLSNINALIKSFANGFGWNRDFRLADDMYSDAGTTPAVDGDTIQQANNQSIVSGAFATYWDEGTVLDRPVFKEGTGIRHQTGQGQASLRDTTVTCAPAYEDVTLVLAVKYTEYFGGGQHVNLFGGNFINLQAYGVGGTDPGVRLFTSGGEMIRTVTPDANDIMVLMAAYNKTSGDYEVWCNNTLVDTFTPSGTIGLTNSADYELRKVEFKDTDTDARLLGTAVIPGKLTSTQRQMICDYYQQNAGVVS